MVQSNLIGIRKTNQLSQQEIADILGISVQSYGAKELGKKQFKCDEMFILAKYFKLTVEDIFLPSILQNGVKRSD